MKLMKLFAMLFMVTCYVDGGEGGGNANGTDGGNSDGASDNTPSGNSSSGDELLAGKYKTQDELVHGYTELQTAFSGKDELHGVAIAKFASPEEYVNAESWKDDNTGFNRMLSVLRDVGQEHPMNQETFEAIANRMATMEQAHSDNAVAEVIKTIPNYENRAKSLSDTALKYLRPDQAQAMDSLMVTKESFEAVELLLSNLRGVNLTNSPVGGVAPVQDEATLRKDVKALNPANASERSRVIGQLNAKGDGEGKLV